MKTFRKSHSAEVRNAHKAIAYRGGSRGNTRLAIGEITLSGRRLRRAARGGRAAFATYVANGRGGVDVPPNGLAELALALAAGRRPPGDRLALPGDSEPPPWWLQEPQMALPTVPRIPKS